MKNINIDNDFIKIEMDNIDWDKKINYIFGMNGSGKTTFTRAYNDEKSINTIIYNSDYVRRNIYTTDFINDKSSNKQDTHSKKKTFEIFFGEKLNELNKTNLELKDKNDSLAREAKELVNELAGEYEELHPFMNNVSTLKAMGLIPGYKIISENEKSRIKSSINNLSMINIVNDSLSKMEKIYSKYDELLKAKDLFNSANFKKEITQTTLKLHKAASNSSDKKIHFMRNEYEKEEIKKYLLEIESDKSKMFEAVKKIRNEINDEINKYSTIAESQDIKNVVKIKEHKSNVDKIKFNISKEVELNKKLEYDGITKIHVEKEKNDEIRSKIIEWVELNRGSIIKEHKKFHNAISDIKKNNELLEANKKQLKELAAVNANKVSNLINKHLKNFDVENISIQTRTTTSSNSMVCLLDILDNDISGLSDGESKSLALAYFLADLEMNATELTHDTLIMIDDPFDSNDHHKADLFKNIKMSNEELGLTEYLKKISEDNGIEIKVIILTHNISALSSMLRNIVESGGATENLFLKIKDSPFIEYIDILELRKGEKVQGKFISKFSKLNIEHFFPLESRIIKYFDEHIKEILESDDHKSLINIRIYIFHMLRLLDFTENEKRAKYKKTIMGEWLKNYEGAEVKALDKSKLKMELKGLGIKVSENSLDFLYNENINNPKQFSFEPSVKFEGVGDEMLIRSYFVRYSEILEQIFKENNTEKIKRARHKQNYHYSGVGFAVEE